MEAKGEIMFRFFNEIGIIEQLARVRLERILPAGMRMAHFSVLNHFVRLGGARSPASLAEAFQVTRGAMTNTLQRLEDNGFVEIKPDPDDGRGKRVSITRAGRQAHQAAIDALVPSLQAIGGALGTEPFERVLPDLERVRVFLDENR